MVGEVQSSSLENTAQHVAGALTGLALILAIGSLLDIGPAPTGSIDAQAAGFMLLFLFISAFTALVLTNKNKELAFLLGLFALLIGWRIASIADVVPVMLAGGAAFIAYAAAFYSHARRELGSADGSLSSVYVSFFRLYLGLDLVPHFTEKLFAGPGPRGEDVSTFDSMGVPSPFLVVLIAGVIEFAAAVGIGLGLLTRLAAPATTIYLLVATVIGGHFTLGFIWASPGGGWEYPLLWSVLILTFVFGGGRWLSLDAEVGKRLPAQSFLRSLMART